MLNELNTMSKNRIVTILCIILITPIGFATKFYNGPAAEWISNSMGGALYEIFWCLIIYLLFPKLKIWRIVFGVFLLTCLLEFLQLYSNPILAAVRSTFIGRTIIGTSFVASDFIYYFLGSISGWLILKEINKLQIPDRHHSDTDQQ